MSRISAASLLALALACRASAALVISNAVFTGSVTVPPSFAAQNGLATTDSVITAEDRLRWDGVAYVAAGTSGVTRLYQTDTDLRWLFLTPTNAAVTRMEPYNLSVTNYSVLATITNTQITGNLSWQNGALVQPGGYTVTRSSDGGTNWTALLTTNLYMFCAVHGGGQWLLGNEDSSVFLSSDDGASWTRTAEFTDSGTEVSCADYGSGVWHAGTTGKGLWRSEDHGTNWSRCATGLASTFLSVAQGGGSWIAGSSLRGLWLSDGTTTNWTQSAKTNLSFRALAYGEGTWLAGGDSSAGLWKSTDLGTNWVSCVPTNWNVYAVTYTQGVWVAAIYDKGLIASLDDAVTWSFVDTDPYYYSVAVSGPSSFAARWYSAAADANWVRPVALDFSVAYAAAGQETVLLSADLTNGVPTRDIATGAAFRIAVSNGVVIAIP